MILFNHYFSRRTLAFLAVLILAISVPFTLFVARRQQDIRQRASEVTTATSKSSKKTGYIIEFTNQPVAKLGIASFSTQQRILQDEHENAKQDIIDRIKNRRKTAALSTQSTGALPTVTNEFTTAFNGIAMNLVPEDVETVKQSPYVKGVYPDLEVKTLLNQSVPLMNVDKVWPKIDGHGKNITGQGVTVAVLDTGIDTTHQDLGHTIITDRTAEKITTENVVARALDDNQTFAIDGNRLAYPANKKVKIYDFTTKATTEIPLFADYLVVDKLAFHDNVIAYYAHGNTFETFDPGVYAYDLNTNTQKKILPQGTWIYYMGSIHITNGKILYERSVGPSPQCCSSSIFSHDLATDTEEQIAPLLSNPMLSVVSDGKLAYTKQWTYYDNMTCFDRIRVYDIATKNWTEYFPPELGPTLAMKGNMILYAACNSSNFDNTWSTYYVYDITTGVATRLNTQGKTINGIKSLSETLDLKIYFPYNWMNMGSIQENLMYLKNSSNTVVTYDKTQNRYVQINLLKPALSFQSNETTSCYTSTDANIYCHTYDPTYSYPFPDTIYNTKIIGGHNFITNSNYALDDFGHGTHVAATIGGINSPTSTSSGILTGVAPDVKMLAYKVLDAQGSGSTSDIISAIDTAAQTRLDSDPLNNVDVISMSLGVECSTYTTNCGPDDPRSRAIDNAVDAGIVAVIAAGNSGPDASTINSPGTARKAITVGAVDKNKIIASFSSRGPVVIGSETIIKPDVVAPGVSICAAEWFAYQQGQRCFDDTHIAISGTSMATPHVAGLVALVKQAYPTWSPSQIKSAIKNNAVNLGYNSNTQGSGFVNALPIFSSFPEPTATPTPTPLPTPTPTPITVTIEYSPPDAGWNLIGVPVTPPAQLSYTADNLLRDSGCQQVAFWSKNTSSWTYFGPGTNPPTYLGIQGGKGYFLKCTANNRRAFSITGERYNYPPILTHGWNLIALPYDRSNYETIKDYLNTTEFTVEQLANIKEVDMYEAGGWTSYIKGLAPNNFALSKNKGYFFKYVDPAVNLTIGSIPSPDTPPPSISPTSAPAPLPGDVNGDRVVNIQDFEIWRCEFVGNGVCASPPSDHTSDLDHNTIVDLADFIIWRNAFNP